MSKGEERKFKKIMEKSGLGDLVKTESSPFNRILEKAGLEKLDQPVWYVVIYHDPLEGKSYIYDKFKTKAEREKWYDDIGMDIEEMHHGEMERPDNPMTEKELKEISLKGGQ